MCTNQDSSDTLFDGVRRFNTEDFQDLQDHFRNLGRTQSPHTLFIGCSDSRVVPSLITSTLPGELFVVRNIANIVPPFRQSNEYLATTSAIEYAVNVLNVDNILICGHSHCGGCQALYLPEDQLDATPHTRRWLELAHPVRNEILKDEHPDPEVRRWKTEQLNIVLQMNHLLSYPFINRKVRNGSLNILGWYYIIESGAVFNYNPGLREFIRI